MNSIAGVIVTVVVLVNIALLCVLLVGLRRRRGEAPSTTETTGHVWDEDLRELNNPLPRWWLWLFVITIVYGLGYLVVYPGLGNFPGVWSWTSQKQLAGQSAEADRLLEQTYRPFEKRDVRQLATDPNALRIGRNLFVNNCAACHGSDARGAPGFPDLTDKDWLWGGTPSAIVQSIAEGRTSTMPAWRAALGGDSGVEDVLRYVMSLSGRQLPAGDLENGRAKFATICAACHGSDGRGNQQLGAPNLTDHIWLNGGSLEAVRESIANGRHAEMPAHLARLGKTRVDLLAAYVISLGGADLTSALPSAPSPPVPSPSPAAATPVATAPAAAPTSHSP
ncbi:MAG TPA: cytochrome-c oxidase, cbb3-type subunit III [Steroidobacteraceae bacterium]|nr:cytochrome-c oxidase, cbb3-type subunit III [Steroidobacteraceae bacterium]